MCSGLWPSSGKPLQLFINRHCCLRHKTSLWSKFTLEKKLLLDCPAFISCGPTFCQLDIKITLSLNECLFRLLSASQSIIMSDVQQRGNRRYWSECLWCCFQWYLLNSLIYSQQAKVLFHCIWYSMMRLHFECVIKTKGATGEAIIR